jgi:hypothetical protein
MRPNNVKYYTKEIKDTYKLSQEKLPTLIEYIEYIDNTDKGYRVESKNLFNDTIEQLDKHLNLKLVSIHPTLDRTVIATYHYKVKSN